MATEPVVTDVAGLVGENGQIIWPSPEGNPEFFLQAPSAIDFRQVIERAANNFELTVTITATQFEDAFSKAKEALLKRMPNLARNVILAGLMPPSPEGDIGENLPIYVKALQRGYCGGYPHRAFRSNIDGIKGCVEVVEPTGHQLFVDRREWTVFVYVADCMRNCKVTDQWNPPKGLITSNVCIAGLYDGLSILGQYPEVLACGQNCPGIDFSGVRVSNGGGSFVAGVGDNFLKVRVSNEVGVLSGDFSGAISVLAVA